MTDQREKGELERFDVSIDRDAEVPIGLQLGWTLCARIRDGSLKPGQRLPGLREMADASGLNVNTVRAVYQRLEQKGVIESQQGSGTFVTSTSQMRSEVTTIAAEATREAHATGVDPRDVAATLYVAPTTAPVAADAAVGRRRALRVQIAVLEQAIGEIESEHPGVAPPSAATRSGVGPALLSAEELGRVRAQLLRRLAAVQGAIDGHVGEPSQENERSTSPARDRRTVNAKAAKAHKRASQPRKAARPATAET